MQKNQGIDSTTDTLTLRPGNSPLTPMATGSWTHKSVSMLDNTTEAPDLTRGGRGRSRKRSALYSNLASYHTLYLELLTAEFLAEVSTFHPRRNVRERYH